MHFNFFCTADFLPVALYLFNTIRATDLRQTYLLICANIVKATCLKDILLQKTAAGKAQVMFSATNAGSVEINVRRINIK
jgi:hypothetical protein